LFVALVCWVEISSAQSFMAGVAKVNATLPLGAPLAGYNHGDRRVKFWPLPDPGREYTNWMTPSQGTLDPTWCKVLIMNDGDMEVAFVTIDAIGMDGSLASLSYDLAVDMGFRLPRNNVIFSGSHSHSGPGAISPQFLWAAAPATDLMVPALQILLGNTVASAMVEAQNNMAPAKIGVGQGMLYNATKNRRAGMGILKANSIDPHLGVIRIDTLDNQPIATLWNFAIHGVCYGPSNMKFSGDIMGYANELIESGVGGVSLFVNADAGDIDPGDGMCDNPPAFVGSGVMADMVMEIREVLPTTQTEVQFKAYSQSYYFGLANVNFTLARFDNCTIGGPLNICTICRILDCTIPLRLNDAWLENNPYFTAFSMHVMGESTVVVTIPGEGLFELGLEIYQDTANMNFNRTFLAGYSNNHMGYFATPDQYVLGGYESQLTFWGINTTAMVRAGCSIVANQVKP